MASWWASRFTWRLALCLNSTLAVRLMDGALWVHQTLRFSSNLVRRPAPLRRTIVVSLSLGRPFAVPYGERCPLPALIFHTALSIPRSHNCPIVSHSAVHRVFSTPQPAALALSLFYFRVQALFQTHAPLSPCCWCFLLSHGPLLPLARTRLSVGALAVLTTRFQGSPGALIVVHSGRSFLRLLLQLFVGMSRLVDSCVVRSSKYHSSLCKVDPAPISRLLLVCERFVSL